MKETRKICPVSTVETFVNVNSFQEGRVDLAGEDLPVSMPLVSKVLYLYFVKIIFEKK